jgi:hypothetical protein
MKPHRRGARATKSPATVFMSGLWARAHPEARACSLTALSSREPLALSRCVLESLHGLGITASQKEQRSEVTRSSEVISEK